MNTVYEPLVNLLQPHPDAPRLAGNILAAFDSPSALRRASLSELASVAGGEETAGRIQAALEFARHVLAAPDAPRPTLTSSAMAAALVMHEMRDLPIEQVRLLLLDAQHHLLASPVVLVGAAAREHLGDVFRPAVERGAKSVVVIRNRPSGDPTPDIDDIALDRDLVTVGRLLDIHAIDHIIIGGGRWVSLRESAAGYL